MHDKDKQQKNDICSWTQKKQGFYLSSHVSNQKALMCKSKDKQQKNVISKRTQNENSAFTLIMNALW